MTQLGPRPPSFEVPKAHTHTHTQHTRTHTITHTHHTRTHHTHARTPHTHTYTRQDFSQRVISSSRGRYLHKTQQTNSHTPSNQEATDLRLRPQGHMDRMVDVLIFKVFNHPVSKQTQRQLRIVAIIG
jgi:hypothetical protein